MEQLVNFIIRPPRADYSPNDDLLGQEFMLKGSRWFHRKDLEIINGRGKKLQCSHYMPLILPEGKTLPCVIYCHGNSGCRADASEAAVILLPSNITVFTLDFSGSGLSEGEHVTLGWNEKDDLKAVVDYLRTDKNVSCIGLWGRSMGAVTSLMYGAEDPSIAGIVLDSPFSNLVDLMMELVDTYKYPVPKFTVKLAIQHMRKVIKKKANFDIMDLDAIQVAKSCFVPVLLGHAIDDDFINPHHSDRIYDSYMGDKNIIKFDGDHNSPRPQFYFDSITIFFHNVLDPPKDAYDELYLRRKHDAFVQDNWGTIYGLRHQNQNSDLPRQDLATISTEDTIAQLRSRRPMSRTDVPQDISIQQERSESEEHGTSSGVGPSGYHDVVPTGHLPSCFTPYEYDECLDYSFDNFSGMPCSIEDEERMINEAMMESLKDLELRQPQDQPNIDAATSKPLDATVNSSIEPNGLSSGVAISKPSNNDGDCRRDSKLCDEALLSIESEGKINSVNTQSEASNDSKAVESSSSTQNTDAENGTRATLVVQKNPSSHIVEGLAHRWSNFFKSNR